MGKLKYVDAGQALKAKPFLPYGRTLVPRKCAHCGHWHLGPRDRRARLSR